MENSKVNKIEDVTRLEKQKLQTSFPSTTGNTGQTFLNKEKQQTRHRTNMMDRMLEVSKKKDAFNVWIEKHPYSKK